MATANVTAGRTWTLAVASAATSFTLTAPAGETTVFVATTAADNTAPATGVIGHAMTDDYPLTRTLLPSGSVWVRAPRGSVVLSVDAA